jgi:hypothetical protein
MTDESPAGHGRKMSQDLKRFRAFARALFKPAATLAILGSLGCLAVAGLGQFECADHALIADSHARDYLVAPIGCLFALGMMRLGGRASGEKLRQAREAFELHDFPLIEVFSTKITFHTFVFVAVMLVLLAMLCIPVGAAFINLKSIWIDCVPTHS